MSILIDYNQVFISSLMASVSSNAANEINEGLVRHMVLSSILYYKKQFSKQYGEMIFCCDGRKYWRKNVFPYYKANRKKMREKSDFDWNLIFNSLNVVREELRDTFGYKVIIVEEAEADDVIATMCKRSQTHLVQVGLVEEEEPILIVSGDHDFGQLQKYSNVRQYSPRLKKMVNEKEPTKLLLEHIIRGDPGDGIPNMLSSDDVFIQSGKKQSPLRTVFVEECLNKQPEEFCTTDTLKHNFARNQMVIDLSKIPDEVEQKILSTYDSVCVNSKKKNLLEYFVVKKLKNLFEHINEF